jgi:hypothetical protein
MTRTRASIYLNVVILPLGAGLACSLLWGRGQIGRSLSSVVSHPTAQRRSHDVMTTYELDMVSSGHWRLQRIRSNCQTHEFSMA